MESGLAHVARAREHVCMPAQPLLVAAMNPCSCGFAGDPKRVCRCSAEQIQRYQARVSGPVVDRFDIHLRLRAVSVQALDASQAASAGESSSAVRARVCKARACAAERRLRDGEAASTTRAGPAEERALDQAARQLLMRCIDQLGLSLRAYAKALRVSRTLADLEGSVAIHGRHVAEAVQYRVLDRDPGAATLTAEDLAANSGSN
jgi:magnesium chelatase family protein